MKKLSALLVLFTTAIFVALLVKTQSPEGYERQQEDELVDTLSPDAEIEKSTAPSDDEHNDAEALSAAAAIREIETSPSEHDAQFSEFDSQLGEIEALPGVLQSPARPLGMEIIDIVQAGGSDPESREFAETALPQIDDFLKGVFKERANIEKSTLDLSIEDLTLRENAHVRVYFIKEGTIFQNSLGIHAEDEPFLIFPNASSAFSYYRDADTRATETNEKIPLIPGDFVDIGNMRGGDILDFFVIQGGAINEDGPVFWAVPESNENGRQRAKLHGTYGDNILIVGFEDASDRDYNDLVFAVELTDPR